MTKKKYHVGIIFSIRISLNLEYKILNELINMKVIETLNNIS